MNSNYIMLQQSFYIVETDNRSNIFELISSYDINNIKVWDEINKKSIYNEDLKYNIYKLQDIILYDSMIAGNRILHELYNLNNINNNTLNENMKEYLIDRLKNSIHYVDTSIPLYC